MALRSLKSIYTYLDYRKYLRDYFADRQKADPSYSHRKMAKEFGFSSPGYIKTVIDRQYNIGLRSLERLNKGLGFKRREQQFFTNLVFFCQAKKPTKKEFYFNQMVASRPKAKLEKIGPDEYKYFSEWYHCVVRELIVREPTPIQYENIAKKILPTVTPRQIKKSVALLVKLGIIKKNKNGMYTQSSGIISTGHEVTSLGIRNYHEKMIDMGKNSMDTVEREKREVSSVSLCVSSSGAEYIKQRIQDFHEEMLQIAHQDTDPKFVYQLNFQFFPLTREIE